LSCSSYEREQDRTFYVSKITIKPRVLHKKAREVTPVITMLSITECKKILNKNGIIYNDDEVEKLREALYKIAEIVHSNRNN